MKNILILLCLLVSFKLVAQTNQNLSKRDTTYPKISFSANVGGMFNGEGLSLDASLGSGYRFTRRSAVGLDLRLFSASHNTTGVGVTGLNVFYEYNRGIYYKGGIGFPLKASHSESECYSRYDYQPLTGFYFFNRIGYHTKKGFTIGLNVTVASRLKFDYYYRENGCYDETGPLILSENTTKDEFLAFTLNLGYELPFVKSQHGKSSWKRFFFDNNPSFRRFSGTFSLGVFKLYRTFLDAELSGNYRLSKYLVTGLEGRIFYDRELIDGGDFDRKYAMKGLGAHLLYDNGLYVQYSYGILMNGDLEIVSRGVTENHKIKGNYDSFKLGYHFENGVLVGFNITSFPNMKIYRENGTYDKDQNTLIGLLIGYSLPN